MVWADHYSFVHALAVGRVDVACGTIVAVVVYHGLAVIFHCIRRDLLLLFLTRPIFGDMSGGEKPVPNPFPLLEVLDVNVVEALVPSRQALTLEGNNIPTEATPELRQAVELRLTIWTDAVLVDRRPHVFVARVMVPFQVLRVDFLPIE